MILPISRRVLTVLFLLTSYPVFADNFPPKYEEALKIYNGGNYEKSLEVIRSVFDDYKQSHEFRMLAAANYYKLGNTSSAIAHLEFCEKDHPDMIPVKIMLAGIQRESGLYTAALATLKRGLDQSPGNVDLLLEEVKVQYKRGSLGQAKRTNEMVLSKDPNNFGAVVNEGILFLKAGKYEASEFRFRQALQIPHRAGKERASVLNNLAYSIIKQILVGKVTDPARREEMKVEAISLLEKAAKEDPALSNARENMNLISLARPS